MGHGDRPSWLTTDSVIPWATMLTLWRRFMSPRPRSLCEWMSMKPGARNLPAASIVRFAFAAESAPIAAIFPPVTATSAMNHGLPEPSRTRAFLIRRSYWADACRGSALGPRELGSSGGRGPELGARDPGPDAPIKPSDDRQINATTVRFMVVIRSEERRVGEG